MAFSSKQMKVLQFAHSNYDAIICDGAVRSGKSSVIGISFILWSMSNFTNQNFIIASQTVSSAIRNIIKPLLSVKYLKEQFSMRFTISNNLLTVSRGKKINYYYLFGGKDEASYGVVQGLTSAGAFLDEVALMPESFVNQVLARCSVEGAKYWFSCNPEGPTHWFKTEWINKADQKNAMYLHFTMEDNPSLTTKVKERYRNMYTGVFFDRYILGRWVKAEGIIYRKFADNPEKYILKKVPEDLIFINAGIDFGGNASATAFVATGYTKGLEKVIVLEAKRITEELSPETLDAYFVDWCRMVYDKYHKPFNSRADNAEPVLMRGLKNAVLRNQLHTQVLPAQKREVLSRIKLINKLIGLDRFFVMEWATPVINALNEAVWDDKHENVRLDDGSTDIDTLDAMEYSIEEHTNKLIDL